MCGGQAQGCAEAMAMANLHRYIHARKQRTLKAEEALAGAERVISDQVHLDSMKGCCGCESSVRCVGC